MLPKISMVYDRKKNRKVEACVYYAGKRRYLATGITVPEGASFSNGMISGCKTAPSLNKVLTTSMNILLGQLQEQAEKEEFDLSAFSLALAFNTDSFVSWANSRITTLGLREGTKVYYKAIISCFEEQGIKQFSDLTTAKLQKAVDNLCKVKRPTTLRAYYTVLMSFVRSAKQSRLVSSVPEGISLPKGKTKDISYLTKEELAAVEALDLDEKMAQARDMFLFACYTGLAYSDLTKIKKSDVIKVEGKPYIVDRRKKTGSRYRLRLMPKAMAILERYNYDLNLMGNSCANHLLNKIEKMDGVKKHLSMHVGRHTFATLALSSGVRIETVSRMLAHADIKTTQIYAKVLQKDVDEGFDILEGKI